MGVHESLEVLKKVQEVDGEIHKIKRELTEIPEAIHELQLEFEAEKARMNELETKLKQTQLRQKQKEGELAEKEALIRKYDSQLTQVKTNAEYSALQKEIGQIKADNSMLEDAIITILDEVEKIYKDAQEEKERLARIEKESQVRQAELTKRAEELKVSLAGLTTKRGEIISQVPPEIRDLYDKIIEKKEGLALVPIAGDDCGACRMEIRPQLLNEIRLKENLVICEHCNRILYSN
ncbi:MAG: hypothetical protein HY447_04945 [Candidatus Omnitrophica bacterium]|nr:hypothetical protein [Candidatus Omnitrophota bacterium]